MSDITQLVTSSTKDDALVRPFLAVWPVVESILEAFSKATGLPIFVFLNEAHLFQSSEETLPPFCAKMLAEPSTAVLCVDDGRRRAAKEEPDIKEGIQLCHAGMVNGRREIETGIGTLIILFGSKKSAQPDAVLRRNEVIRLVEGRDAAHAAGLREAADSYGDGDIEDSDIALMDAIADIIQRLISATVGFRSLIINMAHELSVMLLGMGLLAKELDELVEDYKEAPQSAELTSSLLNTKNLVYTQCRLGLYIVRNFLSHASETRYNEVARPHFKEVNLEELLNEMLELHRLPAAQKGVTFDNEVQGLPTVYGSDMEIRRLLNNVINNAIKYSYHSIPNARRSIKVRGKVPYDPGFKQRRFSVTFENYGLGLTEEERRNVFKPGFRGTQAIAEVPIGSGIGLSEAHKIMKLHEGEIRLQSKELYKDAEERRTYLTTVDLIFPYAARKARPR